MVNNTTRAPSPRQVQEAFGDLARTAQQILAIDPDMPAEDQRLWQDMLEAEAEGADPYAVIDRLVHAAITNEAYASGVKEYRAVLSGREGRHLKNAERQREVVQQLLDRLRISSLVRPTYTASISAGRVHVVPTKEAEEMPPRFQRTTITIDKAALTEALKAGEEGVPATWSNAEPTLTIRVR